MLPRSKVNYRQLLVKMHERLDRPALAVFSQDQRRDKKGKGVMGAAVMRVHPVPELEPEA